MKKNNLFEKDNKHTTPSQSQQSPHSDAPINEDILQDSDLEIINLDEDDNEDEYSEEDSSRKGIYRFFNLHVLLAAVFIFVIAICFFRLKNWGVMIDLDEIFKDGPGTYEDTLDEIFPLLDANAQPIVQDQLSNIVVFGNAPFADDRGSEDNMANMLAELTGANVYNCAIKDSVLACDSENIDTINSPRDLYSLFYLTCLAVGYDYKGYFDYAKGVLLESGEYPEDADEVIETLTTLDFNTVDAIVIMYDATDYYESSTIYDAEAPRSLTTFTGALEISIAVLQSVYPDIRIIVASPTYAYAVNEAGEHVSSDQYTYNGHDILSSYVIREGVTATSNGVSFIDNIYGTVTEDNAEDYLLDNLHLNKAGRELVAERCEYFLNYYIKGYGVSE